MSCCNPQVPIECHYFYSLILLYSIRESPLRSRKNWWTFNKGKICWVPPKISEELVNTQKKFNFAIALDQNLLVTSEIAEIIFWPPIYFLQLQFWSSGMFRHLQVSTDVFRCLQATKGIIEHQLFSYIKIKNKLAITHSIINDNTKQTPESYFILI